MMKPNKMERTLLATMLGLLALGLFGPHIAQPVHQHAFADQRVWVGIPFAMDVLSNLAFALWGAFGLAYVFALGKRRPIDTGHALTGLFFAGLVCTAAASAWYHLRPDDAGLGVDRLGMVLAFAGLLGLAITGRVSHRAGAVTSAAVLILGPLSIWFWLVSGNVLPWLVIQFGGMALMVWMAVVKPLPGALPVRWGVVVAVYAAAKLPELADHQIYEWTGHFISGHSLKHLVASFAVWPVAAAVVLACNASQNPGRIGLTNAGSGLVR